METSRLLLSLIIAAVLLIPSAVLPEISIPVKAKIKVYWRYIPARMNPLDIRADFKGSGTITASKSPFGGGSITGSQIISLIKKKSMNKKIVRFRALSLKNGQNPANLPTLASIVVRNDSGQYDNYIIKTKSGALALFVDVLISE